MGHTTGRSRRARGSVSIIFAIMLPVLMLLTGLAIDVGFLTASRSQLESAAASAALACQSGLAVNTATAISRAQLYGGYNTVMGTAVSIPAGNVQLGTWNMTNRTFTPQSPGTLPDACRVTASVTAPTWFVRAVGINTVALTSHAVAQFGSATKAWNIVITQDVTASFEAAIPSAKAADQALLGCVQSHAGSGTHVGLTEFTGVSATLATPQDMTSSGYKTISTAISKIADCNHPGAPPCSGTNTEGAILGATAVLDSQSCTGGPSCAIIIVTDGEPNEQSTKGGTPQSRAVQAAKAACAKGYSIFAIYYSGSGGGNASNVNALVCGKGIFYQTPSPSELTAGALTVCATLPSRLVYQD